LGAIAIYVLVMVVWVAGVAYRRRWPREQRVFQKATISYNAGPLIDRHVRKSSTLLVTGGDGLAVHKAGYPWNGYLSKWLTRGVHIEYLLLDHTSQALDRLAELQANPGQGSLRVRTIDWSRVPATGEDRATLEKMKTFHFVLGSKPKLMWIELEHFPGTVEARDCEFSPPDVVERDPRYDTLKRKFDDVVLRYAVEQQASQPTAVAV